MMKQPKRILVIKLSSFGDIFHALPAVYNLKLALGAEIDWVTQPEYLDLVKRFRGVSNVIAFPRRTFPSGLGTFLKKLRAHRYDYVVDFQGLLKSALVTRLARGKVRIGPSFHREGAVLFYDAIAAQRDKNRHAIDENLDVIRYLGLPVLPVSFPVDIPAQEITGSIPRIAMVPVSRRTNKNWPVSSFIETANRLKREFNASLFLFGSSADHSVCEQIRIAVEAKTGGEPCVNLAGKTNLVEMGSWFKAMNLVIVNDSGPLHMAAALGVPVVTLFGPTDPSRTGPYGNRHQICITEVACRPCFARVCRLPSLECMEGIKVADVVEASRKVLIKTA